MSELNHKKILEEWSKVFLVNDYEDWTIDISPEIKDDFVTIALFLDYKTAKSSGEEKEVYEGIKKASLIILDFLGIQIVDNKEEKKIQLIRKESSRVRDEKLAKEIWG
ncbi:hypothetical protein HN460_04720 [bacterium]|jgi:hypothetical protein|nr:hypothetical protein [bacterium]MBT3794887.1 hypothetical protein [bacterium]MBT4634798.1 hypothetical protein [bacterium]